MKGIYPQPTLWHAVSGGFFLLVFVLFSPGSLEAQVTLTGTHGTIQSDLSDANLTRIFLQTSEESYQQALSFLQQIGFQDRAKPPLEIRIYGDAAQMRSEMPHQIAKEVHFQGFYGHGNHRIGALYNGNPEETKRILRHEVVHHALHALYSGTPPVWLDEGLAELLSRTPQANWTVVTPSMSSASKGVLQAAMEAKDLPSLRQLFALNSDTFYGMKQDIHYATSSAFLAYILQKEGPRVLGNFITQGGDAVSFLQGKLAIDPDQAQSPWLETALR